MNLYEFIPLYRANALEYDAGWRAYDIPASVKPRHVQQALKVMGFGYAGPDLALSDCMARYGLTDRAEAEAILGAWRIWSLLASGNRVNGLRKRAVDGLPEPAG
jgi:hypothetical protein